MDKSKQWKRLKKLVEQLPKYKWSIGLHNSWDKKYDIEGSGLIVDYDDVDHAEMDRTAKYVVLSHELMPDLINLVDKLNHYSYEAGECVVCDNPARTHDNVFAHSDGCPMVPFDSGDVRIVKGGKR